MLSVKVWGTQCGRIMSSDSVLRTSPKSLEEMTLSRSALSYAPGVWDSPGESLRPHDILMDPLIPLFGPVYLETKEIRNIGSYSFILELNSAT